MKRNKTILIRMVVIIVCVLSITFTSCKSDKTTPALSSVSVSDAYLKGEWQTDLPENHGMDIKTLNNFYESIKEKPVNAVLIIKDGYIISQYFKDNYNEDSVFNMHSCTKSVTSALVGIAIDRGLISDINVKISDYFPQLNDSSDERKKEITIEHCLNMTSGFNWPEMTTWGGGTGDWNKADNAVEFVLNREMEYSPGKVFNYNTGGTHLLSAIIQKETGETEYSFAKKNLFEPLGMKIVEWSKDRQGITSGGSGISMSPKDAARFGQLYLNKGKWGDKQIVSEDWVIDSTKKHLDGLSYFSKYGFLWWVDSTGVNPNYDFYYAMGYGGQYIFVVPELNLVTIFASDFPSTDTPVPLSYFKNTIIKLFK